MHLLTQSQRLHIIWHMQGTHTRSSYKELKNILCILKNNDQPQPPLVADLSDPLRRQIPVISTPDFLLFLIPQALWYVVLSASWFNSDLTVSFSLPLSGQLLRFPYCHNYQKNLSNPFQSEDFQILRFERCSTHRPKMSSRVSSHINMHSTVAVPRATHWLSPHSRGQPYLITRRKLTWSR